MKIRRVIQLIIFLLVLSLSVGHYFEERGVVIPLIGSASLHAVCPVGGVVSIYEYFVSGRFVKKVHESSFVLMYIVFVLTILLGPVFCGWICPMGTFQEWISGIGKKITGKKFNTFIPYSVDRYLRFIRYIVLVMVLVKTAQSAQLMFAQIDPYYALFNIWTDEVAIGGYIALGIVTLASLFVERPFCKYFCPYGALLGLFNRIKLFRIERKSETCISCKKCDKACPMNIPLSDIGVSRDHQCISCMECTSDNSCPKSDTLVMSFKRRIISSKRVGITAVLFFIIGVGGSMALDLWKTESTKVPIKYKTGEFEGEYHPGDIRGSYTFGDVSNIFDIPMEEIIMAFSLEELSNPSGQRVSIFEELFTFPEGIEVGTDSIRVFVALYKGLPYTPEEGTKLFETAKLILQDRVTEDMFIPVPDTINRDVTFDSAHDEVAEFEFKGKTTFADLLDQGITEEEIISVIGSDSFRKSETVKDYVMDSGMSFSTVKSELQKFLEE